MAIFGINNAVNTTSQTIDTLHNTSKQLLAGQTGKQMTQGGQGEEAVLEAGTLIPQAKALQEQVSMGEMKLSQAKSEQDQKTAQQNTQLREKANSVKSQIQQQTDDLLQKFEEQNDLLNLDRHKSDIEQIMFGMRLQNKAYIDKLQLEGARNRFDDKSRFLEAQAALVFEDEQTLLKNSIAFKQMLFTKGLGNREALEADRRAFAMEVSRMDLATALRVAAADSDARNEAMKMGAISDLLNAGSKYYAHTQADNVKLSTQLKSSKAGEITGEALGISDDLPFDPAGL